LLKNFKLSISDLIDSPSPRKEAAKETSSSHTVFCQAVLSKDNLVTFQLPTAPQVKVVYTNEVRVMYTFLKKVKRITVYLLIMMIMMFILNAE
jgi:hypothetical protein